MGLLGIGGSALVPWDAVRVDEGDQRIEVSADKDTVKNGPGYGDEQEITPEYEEQVRAHYGISGGGRQEGAAQQQRGAYGDYYDDRDEGFTSSAAAAGVAGGERSEKEARGEEARGSTGTHRDEETLSEERGPDREREHDRRRGGPGAVRGADDELRVQRSEEELRAGTREREAGSMNIRKRVRTDREQVRVPKRREEVSVDRVPVDDR